MAGRGHYPSTFQGHSVQPQAMMRHGPYPGLSLGPQSLEHISEAERITRENQILAAAQANLRSEQLARENQRIAAVQVDLRNEQLTRENQRLAAATIDLRQEIHVTQQETLRLKAHIRSIDTESDIQIRMFLEKNAKMEPAVRAGEGVRNELQQAHFEARNLVVGSKELSNQLQQSKLELQKAQVEVKVLPELVNELQNLTQEHEKIRSNFEYEKGVNVEEVEQIRAMENKILLMAREVEKLRVDVLNAEKKIHAPNPYISSYGNSSFTPPPPPPPVQAGNLYMFSYGNPNVSYAPPPPPLPPTPPPLPPPAGQDGEPYSYSIADASYPPPLPPPAPHVQAGDAYMSSYGYPGASHPPPPPPMQAGDPYGRPPFPMLNRIPGNGVNLYGNGGGSGGPYIATMPTIPGPPINMQR